MFDWSSGLIAAKKTQPVVAPKAEELPKEKGSTWHRFKCSFSCQWYSEGSQYDKFKDICTCKGKFMPMLWRR